MSSNILNISNSEEVVTPSTIDYQYEWEHRIAGEWVDYYYIDEMTFNEVVCDYVDFEYVKFTIKVCDEDVTLFVHISKDREILKVKNPEHHCVSADIILEEVFNIDKRVKVSKARKELMQVIKFTPVTYTVVIRGYIENISVGEITKKQFDYWNRDVYRNILDKLVHGNDGFDSLYYLNIPNDIKIFNYFWAENDNLCSILGACFWDDNSEVVVYDENDNRVWSSDLNPTDLTQIGISFVLDNEFNTKDIKTGTYVFSGIDREKGVLRRGCILLTEEFDPTKLEFHYDRFDGNEYIQRVFYRRKEIVMGQNNSYSVEGGREWELYQKQDEDDDL